MLRGTHAEYTAKLPVIIHVSVDSLLIQLCPLHLFRRPRFYISEILSADLPVEYVISNHYKMSCYSLKRYSVISFRSSKCFRIASCFLINPPSPSDMSTGTGKTQTAVKLAYWFVQMNRRRDSDGTTRRQVLYCGPSNGAVDVAAST